MLDTDKVLREIRVWLGPAWKRVTKRSVTEVVTQTLRSYGHVVVEKNCLKILDRQEGT